MKYNTIQKSQTPEFQAIFKDALEAYKALPWYKRLFAFPFAEFEVVGNVYLTKWNAK